jgi:ribosomal protein S8
MFSPDGALQRAVNGPGPVTAEVLRREGFDDEAIQFAMEERLKSRDQLRKEGWHLRAAEFLMAYDGRPQEALQDAGLDEEAISIIQEHQSMLNSTRSDLNRWYDRETYETKERNSQIDDPDHTVKPFDRFWTEQFRERLQEQDFSTETLRYFAGPQNALRTQRDIERDGVALHAMGQIIPDQPFNPPPPPSESDPWQLETEGVVTQANISTRRIWLGLKYWEGMPVLRKASLLSKPTKRIWLNSHELGGLTRGRAAAKGEVKPLSQIGECIAVTTDRGVMDVRECAERKIGGMVLCRFW